jgi:molybdopterin-synthase adenylyltransferase
MTGNSSIPARPRTSAAMTGATDAALRAHLLRADGQEDICLATYRPSTGATRRTALLRRVHLPEPGERYVHGNATITGDYVLRVAEAAAAGGDGVVLLHSHPGGKGWQCISGPDHEAESSYANLIREITGLPLVGMTLAGRDAAWSARHWDHGVAGNIAPAHSENVRVLGPELRVSWNGHIVPVPARLPTIIRSVASWGPLRHADLTRRSVLVVGLGSVGLDVAVRLAAAGVTSLGLMDFDTIKPHNLDRLIGATEADAWLHRSKLDLSRRLVTQNATALSASVHDFDLSICEPDGLAAALDFDQIICCVDRPWPRAVLNLLAYRDYIPVIDGGIAIDVFGDGSGMRNATWRSHVIYPGRPCMSCIGQLDLGAVTADQAGALDDPAYIAGHEKVRHADADRGSNQESANVAVLSVSAAASILAQYVSLNVAPGGLGEPGPLQYLFSTHTLEHLNAARQPACPVEALTGEGDRAVRMTAVHPAAEQERQDRHQSPNPDLRLARAIDRALSLVHGRLISHARRRLRAFTPTTEASALPGDSRPAESSQERPPAC